MLTATQRTEIIALIETEKTRLGNYVDVATKCRVSSAAITGLIQNNYQAKGDDMWLKVGTALGWKPQAEKAWKIAHTTDYRTMLKVLEDSKKESLFLGISDYAGSGKSTAIDEMVALYTSQNVFKIRCRSWGRLAFLQNTCRTLGLNPGSGHKTPDDLIDCIVEFFNNRVIGKPLLIIDQANSLKPAALTTLIHLYNECEDKLGVTIVGNESLEKTIKRGVKYATDGFDEIDSRFGRKYIKLRGASLPDVKKICIANGISNEADIKSFFEECQPQRIKVIVKNKPEFIQIIKDLRRLKRIVQREKLAQETPLQHVEAQS